MKEFKNKDAYKLIRYYCAVCHKTEYIWNSQDVEISNVINCSNCESNALRANTNQGRNPDIQIPELTPLGIRWFIVETKEQYTARIKKQIEEMEDVLFQDTTRTIVETSLLQAYSPGEPRLVDPLTLNFDEQIAVLMSDE